MCAFWGYKMFVEKASANANYQEYHMNFQKFTFYWKKIVKIPCSPFLILIITISLGTRSKISQDRQLTELNLGVQLV